MNQNPQNGLTGPSTFEMIHILGNILQFIVKGWAAMIYAFTRRNFGIHYFCISRMSGLLILSVWSIATDPTQDFMPHNVMLFSFIGLSIWHRMRANKTFYLEANHSRYNGWPRICDWLPISEKFAKEAIEPFFVILISGLLFFVNPSLALFVFIGAFMCAFDGDFIKYRHIARARQIRDAEMEQESVMDAYDKYFNK